MLGISTDRAWSRARGLGAGALLMLLIGCGLSDYETLTLQTQEREQRFRDENKYLDEPVKIPTRKDKDKDFDVPVAEVFFRPPKGIQPAFETTQRNNLLWRYPAKARGDFVRVEMAFAAGEKEFAADVLRNYQASESTRQTVRQFTAPGRDTPVLFDSWDFDNGQEGCSINVLRGGRTQVAIAYVFAKGHRESAKKAIDLSLQSLAVDRDAQAARQKYQQKSPWQLRAAPSR